MNELEAAATALRLLEREHALCKNQVELAVKRERMACALLCLEMANTLPAGLDQVGILLAVSRRIQNRVCGECGDTGVTELGGHHCVCAAGQALEKTR